MIQIAGGIIIAAVPLLLMYSGLVVIVQGQGDETSALGWFLMVVGLAMAGVVLFLGAGG